MGFAIGWLIFSIFVGLIGGDRTIGFWGSFLLSLLLSPLIGLIITLFSKTKVSDNREKEMLELQKQSVALQKGSHQKTLKEKLAELDELKASGTISQQEWQDGRNKLIATID